MHCVRNCLLLFILNMPQTIFNWQVLDLVLEESRNHFWSSYGRVDPWGYARTWPKLLSVHFRLVFGTPGSYLKPCSGYCERQNYFSLRVICYSWYQKDGWPCSYCYWVLAIHLCQGQQPQWKYGLHKLPSGKGSLSFPNCKKNNWWLHQAKLGIAALPQCLHRPGIKGALAVIMKGTWQAGGQFYGWTLWWFLFDLSGWSFPNSLLMQEEWGGAVG